MDARLHHKLAEIGEGILKEALNRSNPGKAMSTSAFYLGNWIADNSQVVDRRFYQALGKWATKTPLDDLFDKFVWDAPSWLDDVAEVLEPQYLKDLRGGLERARQSLRNAFQTIGTAAKDGSLEKGTKALFKVLGYGRFVAPASPNGPPRMDPASYTHVFEKLFVQYLPHTHLDRPPEGNSFASALAKAPRNKFTKPAQLSQGDLYSYLRDDIEIAAGSLAYLDAGQNGIEPHRSWAAGTFHPLRKTFIDQDGKECAVDDKDLSWNYHLSLLGFTVHAAEDFFAHSTFIDHAHGLLPASYRRVQVAEESERLARRLKRWDPNYSESNWNQLPNDTHIVTGYFDGRDTLISLAHQIEHLIEFDRSKAGKKIDDAIEYDYKKLLNDLLALTSDPQNEIAKANPKGQGYSEDTANVAAKWLWDKYGNDVQRLVHGDDKLNQYVDAFIAEGPLSTAPPSIKEALRLGTKIFGQTRGAFNIYKSLKALLEFVEAPYDFIAKYLRTEVIAKQVRAYVTRWFGEFFGTMRIGCHSLLAKDDEASLFNQAAMECASAVHWYIIKTMARHGVPKTEKVCRSADDQQCTNIVYCSQWIDWLELLEFFLAHPLAKVHTELEEVEIETTIVHVTRRDSSAMSPDSLNLLAREYWRTSTKPGPSDVSETERQQAFWRAIADANYPTRGLPAEECKKRINAVLLNRRDGLAVSRGNFAWKPGVRVLIPNQKAKLPRVTSPDARRLWWLPVITQGWAIMKAKVDADGAQVHRLVPISRTAVVELIETSRRRAREGEVTYTHAG